MAASSRSATGLRASRRPNATVAAAIAAAVAAAKTASASAAVVRSAIVPTSRMPGARGAADAVHRPDPVRRQRRPAERLGVRVLVCAVVVRGSVLVHVRVGVHDVPVPVRVDVEVAAPPAYEQPCCERDDQRADRDLGRPVDGSGQRVAVEHERQPERHQRDRVTEAPCEAEDPGAPRSAARAREDQGRHGREVVGVGRVAQAEQDGDEQRDRNRAAVAEPCDRVVEPEHGYRTPAATAA